MRIRDKINFPHVRWHVRGWRFGYKRDAAGSHLRILPFLDFYWYADTPAGQVAEVFDVPPELIGAPPTAAEFASYEEVRRKLYADFAAALEVWDREFRASALGVLDRSWTPAGLHTGQYRAAVAVLSLWALRREREAGETVARRGPRPPEAWRTATRARPLCLPQVRDQRESLAERILPLPLA